MRMAATSQTENTVNVEPKRSIYGRLLRNTSLLWLWSGETVSAFGDTFFLLAVTWVVYTQSGSILQTAIIQVIWHLDRIIFSPLAGVLADRWKRKYIMVVTNLLAALVVGGLAAVFSRQGVLSPAAVFVTVFLLNSLTTFYAPASLAVIPEMVGRDALATTSGLFSTSFQVISVVGSALAGIVVTAIGTTWALLIDALSFCYALIAIAIARIPHAHSSASTEKQTTLRRNLLDGWKVLAGEPVVWALTWLGVFLNVAAFMGPLYPALVRQQLHGDASTFGLIATVSGIGAMLAGASAGPLERRIGAGRLTAIGWSVAGIAILGMSLSHLLLLTMFFEAMRSFCITSSSITAAALMQGLLPEQYRGRGIGLIRWLSVIAIPLSALIGGWAADRLGVAVLFAAGGVWILGIAGMAWLSRHVRGACL